MILITACWWRHNERDGLSNHQPHDCLLNRLFRRRSKKTPKPHVTGLYAGIHRWQMASNAENVSIWWRHHVENILLKKEASHMATISKASPSLNELTHLTLNGRHYIQGCYSDYYCQFWISTEWFIWRQTNDGSNNGLSLIRAWWRHIAHTKASDAELWCFLWSTSE